MRLSMLTAFALLAAVIGCTNNQLRRSTVGQAHTLTDIQHQQVLQNLATFASNPYALPRHVTLHDGTAQITDNGSILGQVVTGRFLQIGGQRTIVDQWSMLPVTNDVSLRLLRTAYRRALGAPDDLYTDDLANDFAHEIKKQTYQVDDLRTLVSNRALIERAQEGFAVGRGPKDDDDTVEIKIAARQTKASTSTDDIPDRPIIERPIEPVNESYVPVRRAGIKKDAAQKARDRFDKIVSANAIEIVKPGERITPDNLAVIEYPVPNAIGTEKSFYREATPLVIELRRQVYDTNKDLEDIHGNGWLGRSVNKHDIPKNACYVAWSRECGKLWYVWVCPDGLKEFEDFTLKILNFSGLIKEPNVSGSTGVKFTPSGSLGGR
jgi:hypothetical protein